MAYKNSFLGEEIIVDLPTYVRSDVIETLDYTYFTIGINKNRKFAQYAAFNMDGSNRFSDIISAGSNSNWKKDNRIEENSQFGDELYSNKITCLFDRGHIVTREYCEWGSSRNDAIKSCKETYNYTNATPQIKDFNKIIWNELEGYFVQEFNESFKKITILTGPVLDDNDPYLNWNHSELSKFEKIDVQIPTAYWKIIIWQKKDNKFYALGFMLSQYELLNKKNLLIDNNKKSHQFIINDYDEIIFKDGKTYQVSIDYIENQTKLKFNFSNNIKKIAPIGNANAIEELNKKNNNIIQSLYSFNTNSLYLG